MTRDLSSTYSQIHPISKQVNKQELDFDRNPDYRLQTGQVLHQRYVVQESLGKGSFGQVVRALDTFIKEDVAIKIVKRLRSFSELARNEIRLLNLMKIRDPGRLHNIVPIIDWFIHDGHQCIVFKLLSSNLYDVLRANHYRGFSLSAVQHIGRQLLEALLFLRANNIMHCDLKPENVLLTASDRFDVNLIDFGSSCFATEQLYTYIQSRFYRAPEVLLGLPYDPSIDMWSLGCILVELLTGDVLFPGANEIEQIARIIEVLGMPPTALLNRAHKTREHFVIDGNGQFRFRNFTPGQIPRKTLSQIISVNKTSRFSKARSDRLKFLNLIEHMLDYDATTRITPLQALSHSFMIQSLSSSMGRLRP